MVARAEGAWHRGYPWGSDLAPTTTIAGGDGAAGRRTTQRDSKGFSYRCAPAHVKPGNGKPVNESTGQTVGHLCRDPTQQTSSQTVKSLFPTFGRFLLLALGTGMIGGHDHHRRHLVPEQLWQAIQPLLPPPPRCYGGRPRIDDRAALAGIVYQLRTGIPWRLLPTRQLGCGSPVTCWRRLRDWQRAGVWQQLHHQLLDQLGRQGQLDWSRASLDSISVRAKRGAS